MEGKRNGKQEWITEGRESLVVRGRDGVEKVEKWTDGSWVDEWKVE